jgi:CheY-like chemotaxis protein
MSVVVLGDNVDARDMMTLALTHQGARVTAADSAAEARDIFTCVVPKRRDADPVRSTPPA